MDKDGNRQRHANTNLNGSIFYEVLVQGRLDSDWSERMAGMSITSSSGKNGEPQTRLYGGIRDQAELFGVLETLYDLNMSLIEIKRV